MRQTAKYKCEEPRSFHRTQHTNSLPNRWTTEINLLKKNGEFVPVDAVKAYAGRRHISTHSWPRRWMGWWVVSTTPRPLNTGEGNLVITGGWMDPRDGVDDLEKRKLSCCCRNSSPRPSNPQPIVITTDYTNLATELVINKLWTSFLKHQNRITDKTGRLTEGASWMDLQYLVCSIKMEQARQPVPTAEEETCIRYF